MRTQKVKIQSADNEYEKTITLAEYRELKRSYIGYHLVDCTGKDKIPFKFSARDDYDAIECVKNLNWPGFHKLVRIDPNVKKGYELIGVFLDRVWNDGKQK